jgi:hypothetical protein
MSNQRRFRHFVTCMSIAYVAHALMCGQVPAQPPGTDAASARERGDAESTADNSTETAEQVLSDDAVLPWNVTRRAGRQPADEAAVQRSRDAGPVQHRPQPDRSTARRPAAGPG